MENQLNNNEFQDMAKVSPMEMIMNNPGYVHLAENIFDNLDYEKLQVCDQINRSSRQILVNARFWKRKFEELSRKNQENCEEIRAIKEEIRPIKERLAAIKAIVLEASSDQTVEILEEVRNLCVSGAVISLMCSFLMIFKIAAK